MKRLADSINESTTDITFDVKSDIYTVLSDLAFTYEEHNKSKKFNKNDVEKALQWFLTHFYD